MEYLTRQKPHWSFWVLSVIFLIWNVMGGMNFFFQMDTEMVAAMPETHRAIINGRPLWATVGFAVCVFGGALACLMMLFRSATSLYVFIASFVGVIFAMIHTVDIAINVVNFSVFELALMLVMPVVVAAFLIWYSRLAINNGWID